MRVMITVATLREMPLSIPRDSIQAPKGSERLVAAKAELKKPKSVMATCIAARKRAGCSTTSEAMAARTSPSSASWSRRTFFAVDSAISDIEKYPLAMVSRMVKMIESAMCMRGCATS